MRKRRPGDYLQAAIEFTNANPPGVGYHELAILHDAECDHPRDGSPCRCIAEIKWMVDHEREEAEKN